VLEGWRASTIDVDLRFEPESDVLLRELVTVKDRLAINVELASPPDFIPELHGWRERSPLVFRDGNVDVHHVDPYSQALSKIEREPDARPPDLGRGRGSPSAPAVRRSYCEMSMASATSLLWPVSTTRRKPGTAGSISVMSVARDGGPPSGV
jgi:hypothetical protein